MSQRNERSLRESVTCFLGLLCYCVTSRYTDACFPFPLSCKAFVFYRNMPGVGFAPDYAPQYVIFTAVSQLLIYFCGICVNRHQQTV